MIKRIALVLGLLLVEDFVSLAFATSGNLKYDVAAERIVISCRDHEPPRIRTVNPGSGNIVIVDCEREK